MNSTVEKHLSCSKKSIEHTPNSSLSDGNLIKSSYEVNSLSKCVKPSQSSSNPSKKLFTKLDRLDHVTKSSQATCKGTKTKQEDYSLKLQETIEKITKRKKG